MKLSYNILHFHIITDVQAGMHCLLPPIKQSFQSQHFKASGIEVEIPNGAVAPEDSDCSITMAVFLNTTPCSYPCDVQEISPVVMLKPDKEVELLKPIKVTIPHFLRGKMDSEDNLAHMGVLKASDTSKNKNEIFKFEKLLDGCKLLHFGTNEDGDGIATFEIRHFCFLQLYADSSLHDKIALRTRYCLCRLDPKEIKPSYTYYYVLTYKLEMFIKVSVHGSV